MSRQPLFTPDRLRRFLFFLAALFLASLLARGVMMIVSLVKERNTYTITQQDIKQIAEFEAALLQDSIAAVEAYKEEHGGGQKDDWHPVYAPFDPNVTDSATLVLRGLRPWQAHAVRQYVRRGGRWRSAEHFSQLYGLSREDFLRLAPYLRFAPDTLAERRAAERLLREEERAARERRRDSLRALVPEKYAPGTRIDVNTADTLALQRIPGIGRWRARRIAAYRERLGGFVSLDQLQELDDIPAATADFLFVSPGFRPRQLNVNTATFRELVRHPYLSYEQVKDITTYIRLHGPLRSWDDLRLSTFFTPADFHRLQPYFRFK